MDGSTHRLQRQHADGTARAHGSIGESRRSILTSLRVKVLLAFLVVAVAPLSILALFNYLATGQALTNSANQALFAAASQTAVRLDAFITADLAVIGTEAQLPALAGYLNLRPAQRQDSQATTQVLDTLRTLARKDAVFISSYGLLDLNGRNVVDTDPLSIGGDESARDHFRVALETGLAYVSPVEFEPADGQAYLYFSSKVVDTVTGRPVGVLRARYSAVVLQQLVVQDSGLIGPQSYPLVLDENGLCLADGLSSPGSPSNLLYKSTAPLAPARAAALEAARRLPPQSVDTHLAQVPGLIDSLERVDSPEPYFTVQRSAAGTGPQAAAVTRMKTRPWVVAFLEPQASLLAPARAQARNTVALAAMIMVIVALAAIGVARLLTNPIVRLTVAARQVASGNLDTQSQVESNDEIGILAEAFNAMTGRLVETLAGLRTSEEKYRDIVENAVEGIYRVSLEGRVLSANPAMARILAYDSPDELVASLTDVRQQLYVQPDDRDVLLAAIHERGTVNELEFQFRRKDRHTIWVSINARLTRDDAGRPLFIEGFTTDITERKQAEEERLVHLKFLESLDQVNRAMRGTTDLEQMMSNVFDVVLSIFECDRVGLVYPCDPAATSWTVPMERTRPGYPGIPALGMEIPLDPDVARTFQIMRAVNSPVKFGPGSEYPLPAEVSQRFGLRSFIGMALYPKVDKPWEFVLHQCTYPRVWTPQEERLFQEIGWRLTDALSSLLAYRDLRANETRFRIFVDHATDAFFLHDERGTILDVNRQACESLGYSREELIGMPPHDFDVGTDPAFIDQINPRLDAGEVIVFDTWHRRKDGTVIPVEVRSRPFWQGERRFSVSLARNMTERKRAQEALALFRTLIDHTNDAIEVLDLEMGRFLDANEPAYHSLGYTREEFLNLTVPEIDPQVTARSMKEVLQELQRAGSLTYESQHRRKDGSVFPVELNATYIRLDREYVLTVARDITERKQAEQALRESEERLRQITSSLREVVWLRDAQTRQVLYVNPAFQELTGRTSEMFYENRDIMMDAVHPDDKAWVIKSLDQRSESAPFNREHRIIHLDGSVRWVWSRIFPVRNEAGEVYRWASIMEDITERKQAEEEIRQLNQELEQRVIDRTAQLEAANQELEAFAYSVSHDLRAPLRHIDGFLELLQKRTAATLDEHSQHYMTTIASSAKRMGQLIDDLLSFSRMGRHELSRSPVDLGGLVQDVIRELEPDLRARAIHWQIADLPVVTGDRAMLRIALTNLISNAMKFTRPRAHAEIEIGCKQAAAAETIVFVRDNGVGFDMTYADKLFGVFQRLHRADEFEGTGIGLANVRRIINRHGGRTWAQGEVNHGATFYFSLPQLTSEG